MITFLLALTLAQGAAQQPVADAPATRFVVSAPTVLVTFDTGQLQGQPVGLAWNADGTLYSRTLQLDRWGNDKTRHYLVSQTGAITSIPDMPGWAAAYWIWKAAPAAPADPTLKFDVEQRKEMVRSSHVSSGSDLAGGTSATVAIGGSGEGVSTDVAANAAFKGQGTNIVTLRFKGEAFGTWTNEREQPGMRMSWAPKPIAAAALSDASNRLVLVDREGRTVKVPATSQVSLPAWSPDGSRIAFLQQRDKKKFALTIVTVEAKR